MRSLRRSRPLVVLTLLASLLLAQTTSLLPAQVPVQPTAAAPQEFDAPPVPASVLTEPVPVQPAANLLDVDLATHSATTLQHVREAIEKSDRIGPRQKRVLLRRLNRTRVAERVTDAVTAQALDAGYIQIAHGGFDDDDGDGGDVEVLVDWDALIEFIEKLIPLIVQLIGLFG